MPLKSQEQRSFNELFGLFRITVFNKISRSGDIKKNNEILKSVFMKLYEIVNEKTTDTRLGMNLIEFKLSSHNLFPGFTSHELQRLFNYFDGDHDGRIFVEEFVVGIKVPHRNFC
jgi:Ca2+-binding EF-hand superfamily protein